MLQLRRRWPGVQAHILKIEGGIGLWYGLIRWIPGLLLIFFCPCRTSKLGDLLAVLEGVLGYSQRSRLPFLSNA